MVRVTEVPLYRDKMINPYQRKRFQRQISTMTHISYSYSHMDDLDQHSAPNKKVEMSKKNTQLKIGMMNAKTWRGQLPEWTYEYRTLKSAGLLCPQMNVCIQQTYYAILYTAKHIV